MTNNSDPSSSTRLIEQLARLAPELERENDEHGPARTKAIQLSRQLATTLSHPADSAVELAYSPLISVFARVAIGLDLYKLISNGKGPITSKELAVKSGGEELLITRILRLLASVGFVQEVGERQWSATPITNAMATTEIAAQHRIGCEILLGPGSKTFKYFEKYGYKCPTDIRCGITQFSYQTDKTAFEIIQSTPWLSHAFNLAMGNNVGARGYWVDWFPIREHLLQGAHEDADAVLLVDIGGGKGHDAIAFHQKCPEAGQIVLQDLAVVTETARDSMDPTIQVMAYDFFTEQPVKGARAYFYHQIFHDWPEAECLQILNHVKPAMTPVYSKLLIHDMILPEQGATAFHAIMDLTMLIFGGGMERTKIQWRELLDKAGLEVVQFWMPPQADAHGIVEAVLKE